LKKEQRLDAALFLCVLGAVAGKPNYDQIAGQSAERLAALSDGLFGVAMTLLLLDVHLPAAADIAGATSDAREWQLLLHLRDLLPEVAIYLMSFLTLGIFWVGQQTVLNHVERSSRHMTWIHLGFLFAVTLVPLTTRLLVDFDTYRSAILAYWLNIVLLGGLLYGSFGYALRARLFVPEFTYEMQVAVCNRIIIGQSLYAVGAALCFFSTYLSIGFIVLVQLNYVLAPAQWRWRSRPKPVEE
jgi:uncharacterized membrane protein